jgi:hypothetical protein
VTTLAVPDAIPAEIADLDETEAQAITDRIYSWVQDFPMEDMKRAYAGRIWLAMDCASWAEWCYSELNGFPLPAPKRREVVGELSDAGMSQRAIADVTGEPRRTIRRDLAQVGHSGPPVTGLDGKTYQRKPDVVAELKRQIEEAFRQVTDRTHRLEIAMEAASPEDLARVQGFLDEAWLKAGFVCVGRGMKHLPPNGHPVTPSVTLTHW